MLTKETTNIAKLNELKAALEAILFISGEAISPFKLANTLRCVIE